MKLKTLLKFTKSPKSRHTRNQPINWTPAPDISERIHLLIDCCKLGYVKKERVICYRSFGAKTRACARIWGLGRIWQQALDLTPAYVIEVIDEKFSKLTGRQKDHVLIHELLHIPKTFSGALVPHKDHGGVNDRVVHELYARLDKQND